MRKFYLINEMNVRYDLQDIKNSSYFTNPSGLGFDNGLSYIKIGNSFKQDSKEMKQSFVTGTLTFNDYTKYFEFVNYIENSKNLRIIYKPLNTEYFRDIDFDSITKTEKSGSWLTCAVKFNCKGLYYTEDAKYFVVEEFDGECRYPVEFNAFFNDYNSMSIDYNNTGHVEGEILAEIYGFTQQPQLELYVNGLLVSKVLFDITIEEGQKLLYSAKDGENYVILQDENGNQTNIVSCLKLENDNFFKLPIGRSTLKSTSASGVTNKILFRLLTAFKGCNMLYILSKDDLSIKDVLQINSHEINLNINLTGKSSFTITTKPKALEGDYLIKKEDKITYQGVFSNFETIKENTLFKINTQEIDNIFDRKIIINNESIISSVGVEDFIAECIYNNFTQSMDPLLNIPYVNIIIATHTPINASVSTNDGIFNLRTYLGNVKEKYGISLDYKFVGNELNITISKKDYTVLMIDATVEDIITYKEVYKADAIAKVTVLSQATGNQFNYFLRTDRTITTDINDVNRAKGSIETVTCEEDNQAYQKALDTFKSNSYQHNITLTLSNKSKLYNMDDFIIGRNLKIKTKDNGIYDTFVSAHNSKFGKSNFIITCGNMKITLLDKLKGVV